MTRLVVTLILLLILPVFIHAQSDPLSPSNMPVIDMNPGDYPSNIWITDTMQKVRQDSGSPGRQHWGTFYGTQNEFVDFQVHLHDAGSGTPNLSVTASTFVQSSPSSYTIGTSANDIIVYRDAYMHVQTQVTSTAKTYYNSLGYYPDILIPPTDPYHNQATNAWPFTVAAGNNQSAWVDVHIPISAPSGYYLGSITVKSGTTTLAKMPVILAIWQWPSAGHMPSTTTLKVAAGVSGSDLCAQAYGGNGYLTCGSWPGASTADQGVTLASVDGCLIMADHRYGGCSIYPPYPSPPTHGTELSFTAAYGPVYSGAASTILPGAKPTTLGYPLVSNTTNLQNWITWWQGTGYTAQFFTYPCDEPPMGCSWATVVSNGTSAHATTPPTPVLLTAGIANVTSNSALNSADIMTVLINQMEPQGGSLQRSAYNTWLAGNCCSSSTTKRQVWWYNDCVGTGTCGNGTVGSGVTYPNVDIDGLPAANRAFQWLSFRNNVTGELYYTMTGAWEANGGGCCTGKGLPWTDVYAFGGWGEGTLYYPSTSNGTNYVTASGGGALTYPLYLPSIRMKHIRDGMQDYEYLNVLTNNSQGSFVATEINSWITSSYTFETSGVGLQAARSALGKKMHQLSLSTLPAPPPGISIKAQ